MLLLWLDGFSKDGILSYFRVLLLSPAVLAVVTAQADERDNRNQQNREEIVDDEKDDVAENEVDEE